MPLSSSSFKKRTRPRPCAVLGTVNPHQRQRARPTSVPSANCRFTRVTLSENGRTLANKNHIYMNKNSHCHCLHKNPLPPKAFYHHLKQLWDQPSQTTCHVRIVEDSLVWHRLPAIEAPLSILPLYSFESCYPRTLLTNPAMHSAMPASSAAAYKPRPISNSVIVTCSLWFPRSLYTYHLDAATVAAYFAVIAQLSRIHAARLLRSPSLPLLIRQRLVGCHSCTRQ